MPDQYAIDGFGEQDEPVPGDPKKPDPLQPVPRPGEPDPLEPFPDPTEPDPQRPLPDEPAPPRPL